MPTGQWFLNMLSYTRVSVAKKDCAHLYSNNKTKSKVNQQVFGKGSFRSPNLFLRQIKFDSMDSTSYFSNFILSTRFFFPDDDEVEFIIKCSSCSKILCEYQTVCLMEHLLPTVYRLWRDSFSAEEVWNFTPPWKRSVVKEELASKLLKF